MNNRHEFQAPVANHVRPRPSPASSYARARARTAGNPTPFGAVDWSAEGATLAAADALLALATQTRQVSWLEGFRQCFTRMQNFRIPATTFTPMMLYGLYWLAAQLPARCVAVCGVDSGAATAALAAGAAEAGGGGLAGAPVILGSERDAALATLARKNLGRMKLSRPPCVTTGSAGDLLARLPARGADIIFLDSWPEHHPALLPGALRALAPGGLLLLHDPLLKRCRPDLETVAQAVAATGAFASLTLPLDEMGLWLARHLGARTPCA